MSEPITREQNPAHVVSVEEQVRKQRQDLEVAFKKFHELLGDKILDANKSTAVRNTEQSIINNLYKAAATLDNTNAGEGVMSLAIIAIREMLKMRDRVNELEYELYLLRRDFIKGSGETKNDKEK